MFKRVASRVYFGAYFGTSTETVLEDIVQKVLSDLSVTPTPIDLLMKEHKVSAQQMQRIIQELEVSGNIKTFPNGTVSSVS